MDVIPFSRQDLKTYPTKVLRTPRMANALVSCVTDPQGRRWTVKDFKQCPWITRVFIAPILLNHELKILKLLVGLEGVAQASFKIDAYAIAVQYIEGSSFDECPKDQITVQYLTALDHLIENMHAKGIVHLDMRGRSNILIDSQGRPAIIDFQTALKTKYLPKFLRVFLERLDLSGSTKKWLQCQPAYVSKERLAEYERISWWRKLWILKGYLGIKKKENKPK